MSRTRQQPNEIDLWLFPKEYTNTNNHIDQTENTVGIHFKAQDLGMKTRTELDILSGRAKQAGTVEQFKTYNEIEFTIGWNIARVPDPSKKDLSSIIKITSKPQNKRGARHNTTRVIEQIIEVS
jgi:hypothetical protein